MNCDYQLFDWNYELFEVNENLKLIQTENIFHTLKCRRVWNAGYSIKKWSKFTGKIIEPISVF